MLRCRSTTKSFVQIYGLAYSIYIGNLLAYAAKTCDIKNRHIIHILTSTASLAVTFFVPVTASAECTQFRRFLISIKASHACIHTRGIARVCKPNNVELPAPTWARTLHHNLWILSTHGDCCWTDFTKTLRLFESQSLNSGTYKLAL